MAALLLISGAGWDLCHKPAAAQESSAGGRSSGAPFEASPRAPVGLKPADPKRANRPSGPASPPVPPNASSPEVPPGIPRPGPRPPVNPPAGVAQSPEATPPDTPPESSGLAPSSAAPAEDPSSSPGPAPSQSAANNRSTPAADSLRDLFESKTSLALIVGLVPLTMIGYGIYFVFFTRRGRLNPFGDMASGIGPPDQRTLNLLETTLKKRPRRSRPERTPPTTPSSNEILPPPPPLPEYRRRLRDKPPGTSNS